MKLNKIILVGIFLLILISFGAVTAQDNSTCNLGDEENFDDLSPVCEVSEDMQTDIDDKLEASAGDVVADITADNVTVDVSNVFVGQNASISVSAPEATGTVNITVGEKVYTPEFIGGVATQFISQYSIGLNNVTVMYNDVVKQTSFKVLDGVITNETFEDYFEYSSGNYIDAEGTWSRYELYDYIPEGAVLDFRGLINISTITYGARIGVKGLTIMSSTKDAIIYGNINIGKYSFQEYNCRISDLNITGGIDFSGVNNTLINSIVGRLRIFESNHRIDNVTVNKGTFLYNRNHDSSITNSRLFGGITFGDGATDRSPTCNFTIKNCFIEGDVNTHCIKNCTIENNTINGLLFLHTFNSTVVNNKITNFDGNYAIEVRSYYNIIGNVVANNRLFAKNFGNNAVSYNPNYTNVIENNTPGQIPVDISNTKKLVYDENVSICVNISAIGNVTIDVNGKKYEMELIGGIASLIINEYHSGTNNISAYYEDVLNDIYGYWETTFYVEKIDVCPLELDYNTPTEGKASIANVILPDDSNGTIEIKIFNSTYDIKILQNAKGRENKIIIPSLMEGNYIMEVIFKSDKYVTNSTIVDFNVIHIPLYKLTANNVVMDYKDGSKYKVLVTKDGKAVAGEVVKITFNGKTNNMKTDKNGYATLSLDGAPKTYAIKAEYMGVTKSSKVTIKNVLKAKSISKKKAKTIKFQATLKTSKGKAITGKKITFKLKGKKYTAKTNKKGVATISIKKLKVGKYTITSKYGECTVKSTLKIKK